MKNYYFVFCILFFAFLYLLIPSHSFAFWQDLDKDQIAEAIKYGKDLTNKLGSDSDWAMHSEHTPGWVELITPFSAVAKYARDLALQSKEIKDKAVNSIVAPYRNKLIFDYYFYDIDKKFTFSANSEYFVTLKTSDGKILYPIRWNRGTESVQRIYLEFSFPSAKIDPNSTVILLIREPSGFEQEFKFDLSKIK